MISTRQAYLVARQFKKKIPVRKEFMGTRDLAFSQWLRDECRPSQKHCMINGSDIGAFVAFDLDFVIYDYSRNVMQLLEVKTRRAYVGFSQNSTFKILDATIRAGANATGLTYLGLHILQLDGTTPYDSEKILWDGKEVSKEECWRLVNMVDSIENV